MSESEAKRSDLIFDAKGLSPAAPALEESAESARMTG